MDILTELIKALFAVVGSILTLIAKKFYDERGFVSLSDRKKALAGTWNGDRLQEGESIPTPITFELQIHRKKITGTAVIYIPIEGRQVSISLLIEGGLKAEQFFTLEYKNPSKRVIQFGYIILRLNSMGNKMEGKYLGYGSINEQIVMGQLKLEKAT